ncbi:hypothetical protein FBR02_09300 [Anaerolineae bacterium CFX9]|nr:hypothetical protein [Anaerolineae bacterium CFX9]
MVARQFQDTLRLQIEERERSLHALRMSLQEQEQAMTFLRSSITEQERMMQMLKESIEKQEAELDIMREEAIQHEAEGPALSSEGARPGEESAYKIALALTLANCAYDALMVFDDQYNLIAINHAAEELFGRIRPIGESLMNVTDSAELESMLDDAVANEEEMLEEQITLKGRTYRARVQVIRRDENFFIGVALEDIHELVRLNRARRDMVANISHELRTPIANIRLIIDSLFHEQDKPKRKQSTSALKAIARETDSLLWLVQELLDLSMIETGQAILRMVEFPLAPLIDEVVERMLDQGESKAIQIVSEVPDDLEVLADYDQVRRVIVNLVHNAIKWSPQGGTITIKAENTGDEATISVIDNGPGVPDDQTERIFERFYQVDPSRSNGEGTGLGLAICKHIVTAHGGRIWAEGNSSQPGGRFRFTVIRAEERP